MALRITVLGAGITGLSSAVCVQQACPQAKVQLVSENFSPDTTADVSAGFWEPYMINGKDAQLIMRVSEVTYEHLTKLAYSPLAGIVNVQMLSGYHLYRGFQVEVPDWANIVDSYRDLSKKELKRFPEADTGTFYTTATVDAPPYMAWLMKRFKTKGGAVRQAKIENLEQIAGECDILVNCSATGSKHLFHDTEIFPVRGQVWKVRAPWLKHFYIWDLKGQEHRYALPGVEYVTIGGTAQADDWNTQPDMQDAARIWDNALQLLPALRQATPLKSWAGLRPSRKSLRLEAETVTVEGREFKVIHNYGHGGAGVTMHWGCALEVTRMVLESLGTEEEEIRRIISRL